MKSYAVNLINFVQYVMPFMLRKSKMIAFLTALLKPLQTLQDAFVAWQLGVKYDVSITNQVIYLEKLLNDYFDNVQRRIYIEDAVSHTTNSLRMKSESRDGSLMRMKSEVSESAVIMRMKSEVTSEADFIVKKPSSVTDLVTMKAYLNKYKAASMRYEIQDNG